jgi:hypothetical protein
VNVGAQVVTFNQHHATQVHVLTDLGDQVGDGQLNGLAVAEVGFSASTSAIFW